MRKNESHRNNNLIAFISIGLFYSLILFSPIFNIDDKNNYNLLELSNNLYRATEQEKINFEKVIKLGNKLAYTLDLENINSHKSMITYNKEDIIRYLERSLIYKNNSQGYIDLDYIDLCNNNDVSGCVYVDTTIYPNYQNAKYAIKNQSLKDYSMVLFDKDIEIENDFEYKGDYYHFVKEDNITNNINFNTYEISINERRYSIDYYDKYDGYRIIFEIIGAKNINDAKFQNIKVISVEKL